MAEYKTPGIYVEEISTFPASVVRVETAVPIFVGYTELNPTEYQNKAVKVKSLFEYQGIFGGEPTSNGRTIDVTLDGNSAPSSVSLGLDFYLYQSLRHYFANGGGDAYILSIGDYSSSVDKDDLHDALELLFEYDEPTLVLVPDAFALDQAGLGEVQRKMLSVCAEMQDRFAILDVQSDSTVLVDADDFRTNVGNQNLKYGAAYFPPLKTSLGPDGPIDETALGLTPTELVAAAGTTDPILEAYAKVLQDREKLLAPITVGPDSMSFQEWYDTIMETVNEAVTLGNIPVDAAAKAYLVDNVVTPMEAMTRFLYNLQAPVTFNNTTLLGNVASFVAPAGALKPFVLDLLKADLGFGQLGTLYPSGSFVSATALGIVLDANYLSPDYGLDTATITTGDYEGIYGVSPGPADNQEAVQNAIAQLGGVLGDLLLEYQALLNLVPLPDFEPVLVQSKIVADIVQAIRNTGYTLPPSGAVAGAYAVTDGSRGVWKAPANISLNAVREVMKMTESELNDLNIPGDGKGKSINAIRFFRGQGNLIYGARTLAGNDNEWRYVPVRRLFIMVEESIRKAVEPFVFENNDANTWIKVKGMIESFLNGIWRDGGLAGGKPEHAYYVKVGLGQTMTAQDILEGKLIIEIGMAAVRPAEFVVLKFSHLLQES